MFDIFTAIHLSESALGVSTASFLNSFYQRKVAHRNLDLSIKKELLSLYKDFKLTNTALIKHNSFEPQDIRDMIYISESFISHINTKKYKKTVAKIRTLISTLNALTKKRILKKYIDKGCNISQGIYENPIAHNSNLEEYPHIEEAYSEYMSENNNFDYVNWEVFLNDLYMQRSKATDDVHQQMAAYKSAYGLARKEIKEILNITNK
ncbi:hypothetical protein JK207_16025 [Gluconobacter cerinus]|uniref:hypothetical protein n=1 Tax=Gluconobacter cerinus TaxID=38307 RepID=UPI001B8C31AB|nr:hypothetical protein [Gluconobacter cerinus]MBS1023499.1 hypothetical protein [Gluconobacter cerinus]